MEVWAAGPACAARRHQYHQCGRSDAHRRDIRVPHSRKCQDRLRDQERLLQRVAIILVVKAGVVAATDAGNVRYASESTIDRQGGSSSPRGIQGYTSGHSRASAFRRVTSACPPGADTPGTVCDFRTRCCSISGVCPSRSPEGFMSCILSWHLWMSSGFSPSVQRDPSLVGTRKCPYRTSRN